MSAFSLRLPDAFKAEVEAYARRIGVSSAALAAIALREYLDARGSVAVGPGQHGVPAPAPVPKVAAGQPCPSGSRKPYGKCHGKPGGAA